MTQDLAERVCTPCQGGIPPLSPEEASAYLPQAEGWELLDDGCRIERSYRFKNYKEAFAFVQQVSDLAEREGHHPDVSFGWGYARVSLQTKKIKGLHENDFIMAAKINRILDGGA